MNGMLGDLAREHQKIEAVLAALVKFATLRARETPNPREIIGHFELFFREYLDRWHHTKEEELLFPAMIRAGLPADSVPVRCLLREHQQGRDLLTGLGAIGEGTGRLAPGEIALLGELSVKYAALMTRRITRENRALYPRAERLLSDEQRSTLDAAAAAVDAHWGQAGADLQDLGMVLCSRFGLLSEWPPR